MVTLLSLQAPLPGGYKVGDTVYSLVSWADRNDTSKSIVPGGKGKVTGRVDEPNQGTKVEVRFESGMFGDLGLKNVIKTAPAPVSHSTSHILASDGVYNGLNLVHSHARTHSHTRSLAHALNHPL